MKNRTFFFTGLLLALSLVFLATYCANPAADAEAQAEDMAENDRCDHRYPDYDGPAPAGVPADELFYLNQDWPTSQPSLPQTVTDKIHSYLPITEANLPDLMFYLRGMVFDDLVANNFSQRNTDWFSVPHMGRREAMHGMYDGNNISPGVWDDAQTEEGINFTLDLYNNVSAYTIGKMWGDCDRSINDPLVSKATSEFPEGSIVIKLAMTAIPLEQAPFLEGAFKWQVYAQPDGSTVPEGSGSFQPEMVDVHLIQMDFIIKDKVMAPETGWLFSTFVYDQNADPVDMPAGVPAEKEGIYKMIPLGAMWGNDPGVERQEELKETVLNPHWAADPPRFIAKTLGLNGRLSGPIDDEGNRSSCMQCHASAQWNVTGIDDESKNIFGILSYPEVDWTGPEKTVWMQNFTGTQSYGNTPVDPAVTRYITDSLGIKMGPEWIGMDYDFVMTAAALNALQDAGKLKKENILVGKFH